jgi:hypothetical protein
MHHPRLEHVDIPGRQYIASSMVERSQRAGLEEPNAIGVVEVLGKTISSSQGSKELNALQSTWAPHSDAVRIRHNVIFCHSVDNAARFRTFKTQSVSRCINWHHCRSTDGHNFLFAIQRSPRARLIRAWPACGGPNYERHPCSGGAP